MQRDVGDFPTYLYTLRFYLWTASQFNSDYALKGSLRQETVADLTGEHRKFLLKLGFRSALRLSAFKSKLGFTSLLPKI